MSYYFIEDSERSRNEYCAKGNKVYNIHDQFYDFHYFNVYPLSFALETGSLLNAEIAVFTQASVANA